ncbi:hypothetical protein Tco_0389243 [Tanacetum coccineum]
MACEEYSQEVLGFSDVVQSSNPTPYDDPIVSSSFPTLTPFEGRGYSLLESILNSDPSPPPNQESYLPEFHKELKICETKTVEPASNDFPELELKDLPSHVEYAFLEDDNKLPVIIAKDLRDKDKTDLLKVLRAHKHAIARKMSDIKGINTQFYTHRILMEEDTRPTVQQQRRVNPKIYEVIKLLDASLIYLISDSPWVSPVHCVPKKGA